MGWLEIILGALKFPGEVRWLIELLQKTPAEKHADLIASIQKEAQHYAETGRPSW